MKATTLSIGIMILATLLAAVGSLFLKKGAEEFSWKKPFGSLLLYLGLFFYGAGAVFNILAYKGGSLAVIFPMNSLGYVWSIFLAKKYLKETITNRKILAITLICIGVFFVAY